MQSTPTDNGLLGSALPSGSRREDARGHQARVTSLGTAHGAGSVQLTAGGVKIETSLAIDVVLFQVRTFVYLPVVRPVAE